ncbi:MAG: P-loop NTPase fold protein, partial [archaeon]
LVLFLILVPIVVFLGEKYLGINQLITSIVNYFAGFSLLVVFLSKLFLPLATSFFKELLDRITKSVLPVAAIRETIEREERLNSPEQFETLFKEIVGSIESEKSVIVVFDNIDRVQGDTAIKILSTIKTFLDPKEVSGLTFIVPCDSDAINSQIKSFYKDKADGFDSSEYLRKLFNVVIWMPEFIEADLHAFIKKIIEDTGDINKLLKHEDVAFVIGSAFSNNPREIKQFINNLISALVLASKTETEVWDIIKDNIPYLAKVLVLKQKHPMAYQRLKEKWFEPESILQEKDEEGLRNFMLNTSRITVNNAEPFIYFKEPTISRKLTDSVGLTRALVEGDKERTKEIVRKEKDNKAVVDFVELLLQKYRSQKDLQKSIFATHLEVFDELKITTQKKLYYETLARTLDTDLWQFFAQLPTNLIFTSLLTKKELDNQFRKPLVKRYALALDNEETRKPNRLELVKDILTNLKQNIELLDSETRMQISKSVDEHFSTNFEVISLFEKLKEQEDFITPQAFEKFITNINDQTFLKDKETLLQFKEFIIKKKKFGVILQKITELIQKETSEHPDHRAEKETFMKAIGEILSEFEDELDNADDGIKIQLIKQFTQAFNSIGGWDNRTSLVNNLRWLYFAAPDPQKSELQNLINTYCQQASAPKIEEILDYWEKKSAEGFIDDFFPSFLQKSMQDDAYLDVVYKRADKSKKLELITSLIKQKGANSLNFIKKLGDDLPDRQAIVKSLLSKLPSMPLGEQVLIYDYLPGQLSKNDPTDLKDQIVNQMKALLKSDTPASQEAGLNLLTNTDSLSEEKRREIGKEVLNWLRQPDKVLNSNHRFVLKSVASLVAIMQETPISDFTYTLFDMLKQDKDKATLEVSLEILGELKPKYSKHEKDFKDLLDRLKVWPQNENKNLIIEKIKDLKSSNPSKEEKAFWKEIDSLADQKDE